MLVRSSAAQGGQGGRVDALTRLDKMRHIQYPIDTILGGASQRVRYNHANRRAQKRATCMLATNYVPDINMTLLRSPRALCWRKMDQDRDEDDGEHRRRSSGNSLNDGGSGYESGESMAYSEDEIDDIDYGTMARFVPTLVLERLRMVGEAAITSQSSAAGAEISAQRVEMINVPQVGGLGAESLRRVVGLDVSPVSSRPALRHLVL